MHADTPAVPAKPAPDRLALRLSEVAESIGISTRTLRRMVIRGEFPPPSARAGSVPLWSVETVRAWLDGTFRPVVAKRHGGRAR